MTNYELKHFDITKQIEKLHPYADENNRLFWTIDGGFSGVAEKELFNVFETSGNLCFRFEYKPTGAENIYHDIFVEDWTTGKRYNAGYIYFKTYTGYATSESMKELHRICMDAEKILSDVYSIVAQPGSFKFYKSTGPAAGVSVRT